MADQHGRKEPVCRAPRTGTTFCAELFVLGISGARKVALCETMPSTEMTLLVPDGAHSCIVLIIFAQLDFPNWKC